MANVITGNPWVLDTVEAVSTARIPIKRIVWHEPTTANHNLVINDQNGKEIWAKEALAGGAGMDYELADVGWVNGMTIATLDSGTVKVYIGR